MADVLIVLTGRRQHGKDTVADIGINKFNCTAKLALADWFKEELSREFKIPIEKFYDINEKDKKFDSPLILTKANVRHLLMRIGDLGFNNVNRISTMKWWGRQLFSLRDMMLWFGHEFVTKNCGDTFHCKVTERRLADIQRNGEVNAIFITDARQFGQSNYFKEKFAYVYPVRVVRPGGTEDNHAVEIAGDSFPEGYFFETIVNDGDVLNLENSVKDLLIKVKNDLGNRLNKATATTKSHGATKLGGSKDGV